MHPRASAGGGKTLPRAYVARRYTPTESQAVSPPAPVEPHGREIPIEQAAETGLATELEAASELELASQIEQATALEQTTEGAAQPLTSLEAPGVTRPDAATRTEDVAPSEALAVPEALAAPEAVAPPEAVTPPTVAESAMEVQAALLESGTISGDELPTETTDGREEPGGAATSSPDEVAEEWDVIARERVMPTTPGIAMNADVLARVRQQARRPGRVVSRNAAPPSEPREPGRFLVILTTAVLALALLVALAVIFRRAPTAPW